jgi:hypothetical protein
MVGENVVKTSKTGRKKEPEDGFDMATLLSGKVLCEIRQAAFIQ